MVSPVALLAVTLKVDEFPRTIALGFAVIETVGSGFGVTVTVAVAVEFPPCPVAFAV
jgi:hypothetical protein